VVTDMLHGIGIGALGTLTLVMMARTALLRTRQPIMNFGDIGVAALLLSAAAVARLIGPLMPSAQQHLLWFAAIAWCCAFLVLLARFAHTGWRARSSDRR
ncbi:MAG: NnrS family protein, partial [Gammaproteobacteria bacterium]